MGKITMNDYPMFEPCDLVFVSGNSWLSKLIKFFTRHGGEPPTKITHIAGFDTPSTIIEASLKVKKTDVKKWDKKHKYYEVWRNLNISYEEKTKIVKYVRDYENNFYGWQKLFFHMLDGILGKIFNKEIFLFRKLLFIEKYPICSWLWAYGYKDGYDYEFGNKPNVVSPDDMYDFVIKNDDWIKIFKKENGK